MPGTPLHHLTVAEAGRHIAGGTLSPVALVDAFLARIEAVDLRVHSYITVTTDRARAAAQAAERELRAGRRRGPLHGIPFAVKDNYHVAGVPTTAASRLMLDYVPDATATAVARLEQAGAILLGKLNTWELGTGSGMVTDDLPFPVARNPWDTDRLTGGSSTGAAAGVAAGTAMFALGSDTGGSIRLPAAACGVAGLKPTYGRVSRAGCLPNCWSLDHNGPLAWTVEDAALVLRAIAGEDPADPTSADAAVPDYRHASRVINWGESFSMHERDFMERRHLMGESLREKMMCGFLLRAADFIAAQRQRRTLAEATDAVMRTCDALLLPGAFHLAPRLDEPSTIPAYTADNACSVFNLTGHPAISVCTGFKDGLPLSAQVAGRWFDEATVLRVAQAYERATPWRDRRPEP